MIASCRVTVVGSRRRLDLSLPGGVPVAELLMELAEMLGESGDGVPARWGLVRVGGGALDLERGLAEQGVAEGTMLFLRDLTSLPLPPAIDDYAERLGVAVDAQPGRWTRYTARTLIAGGAGVCLVGAGASLVVFGDRGERATAGIVGVALVSLIGLALNRGVGGRSFGALLALAALPLWAAAGIGLGGVVGADATGMVAAGLGSVSLGAAFAVMVAGDRVIPASLAVIAATAVPALVLGGCSLAGVGLQVGAALICPLQLGGLALVAPLAARLAGIYDPGSTQLGAQLRRGRDLVAALLIGVAVSLAASSAVLAVSGGWFARGLVVAVALAAAAKARHFRFAAEVAPLLAAGLAGLLTLEYPLSASLAIGARGIGGAAGLLIADGLVLFILAAAARTFQGWDLSARWRRWLRRLDALATAASVPLALGVIGAYEAAAHFAHGLV